MIRFEHLIPSPYNWIVIGIIITVIFIVCIKDCCKRAKVNPYINV